MTPNLPEDAEPETSDPPVSMEEQMEELRSRVRVALRAMIAAIAVFTVGAGISFFKLDAAAHKHDLQDSILAAAEQRGELLDPHQPVISCDE